MERPYLIDTLNRSGIDPTSDLVDKVVELQRLVFLKINAGSFSRRCAALVELSCRILDIPITKSKLYSALGYKFKQNEYAHELALLKSTLKINFDNNSIWEKLNIIYGEDICTRAQSLFQDFHQKYSSSKMHILPIDVNTTSYKCASLYIVGQMEKRKMDLKEIITLAEVDRATFLKTVKIVRDKVGFTMTEEQIIEGEASVKAVPNTKTSRGTLLLHSAQNGTMKNVEHVNSTPFNRKTSITKIIAEMKEADNTPILNATDIVDDNNSTNSIDNAAGKRKAYEVWVESRKKKKLDEANVDSSNPLKEDP